MITFIRSTAACTVTVFMAIFGASAGALFAALYSQFALGLHPCVLCLYQRMPYIAAMVLALAGLALRKNERVVKAILVLCSAAFLINSGIAAYHSGVERKLWASAVEGCAVPDFTKNPDLLAKILTSPAASCGDIAWKDPFLGLTMANYNVFFSLLLFAGCVIALSARLRPGPLKQP